MSILQTTLATGVLALFIAAGLFPAHVQKKQPAYTGDDPHGLKIFGMPKANHKYLITDLPEGTDIPPEYNTCGQGVYYQKEKVRGVNVTAVMVHFRAEGDFEFTDDLHDDLKLKEPSYVPAGWVALTFTFLPDSLTLQDIRLMRAFPPRVIPGMVLPQSPVLMDKGAVRIIRSWVEKDPYVAWEILPESQLSHLIFRIKLPESSKSCLQGKK